jgi:integrase
MVFRFANERGHRYPNPADLVPPHSIATFQPRDRSLSQDEIRLLYEYLEHVATTPIIRLAVKLLLLTMLRKSELIQAEWSEINFTQALWTIPAMRMKRRNPHNVYLARQALDIFIALKTCAGGSRFVLPSRYDPDKHMSQATLNQVTALTVRAAHEDNQPLAEFTPLDLRRTASTQSHEAGYNTDWIEKCLAHEQKGVRAVYNKAEYVIPEKLTLSVNAPA